MTGRRVKAFAIGVGLTVLSIGGAALRQAAPAVGTTTLTAFPVGAGCQKYPDTWHDPRATNVHVGTDILAPTGTPLYAVVDSTIMRIGTNTLGGNAMSLKQPDGTYFYYAHLSRFADGLVTGSTLKAGDVIGYVGDTGDAKGTPHLHFEVHPAWNSRNPINPYPLLRALGGCGYAPAVVEGRPTDYNPTGSGSTTTTTRPASSTTGGGSNPQPRTSSGPGGLKPVVPGRLVDTRDGAGPYERLTAGVENFVTMTGRGGVPLDATMVVLNLTVTSSSGDGWLAARPCGQAETLTSSVNFNRGTTVATGVMVGLGIYGRVCFESNTDVDLIIDVAGSVGPGGELGFVGQTPLRLIDTREKARPAAGAVTTIAVPGKGVKAASLNVTVVDPSAAGFVTVWPCGSERPTASTLNFEAGQIVANSTTIGVGASSTVCVWANVATHVVVDLGGTWQLVSKGLPAPLNPTRLLDTRQGGKGRLPGATMKPVQVVGGNVPTGATGALLTVTVTAPADNGYLTVYPCGSELPLVSNLNFVAGRTVSNLVTVGLGTVGLGTGQVCVYSNVAVHLVVDLTGYLS